MCDKKTVFSDGGGALGHPRVFINLVSVCTSVNDGKPDGYLFSVKYKQNLATDL